MLFPSTLCFSVLIGFVFVVTQYERTIITEEQREAWKSFFQEGMTSVGSTLIPAAAEATGLAAVVIEVRFI